MKPVVLAFGGQIASGKSTISQQVATDLHWPWVSFGAYVRSEAERRGLEVSRAALQQVSDLLIADGWNSFCCAVLAQVNWRPGQPLIVDGIRHIEALRTLRAIAAPQPVLLVLVDVPEPIRAARLNARGVIADDQQHYDRHTSEAQIHTILPQIADLRIDGARPAADLTRDITHWLEQYTK